MPNTFAMSPGYVKRYIEEEGLAAPSKDVVGALRERLAKLALPDESLPRGRAWQQDASQEPQDWPPGAADAKLIFTSPPYLQVIRYGKYNWIRLWLLQNGPKEVDSKLFTSSSLDRYVTFMRRTIASLETRLRSDGYMALVIGDVRRKDKHLNLAEVVVERCLGDSQLRLLGIIEDQVPTKHKVSRIWKENKGRATKIDRIVLLAGPEATEPPDPPEITWA
jgi:site-specific DNA-methyltransferase (adenine-specific)